MRLNGVSGARRNRLKPTDVTTYPSRFSPAGVSKANPIV